MANKPKPRTDYLLCLLLVAATLAVYWQVRDFGWIVVDDPDYVQQNAHVLGGVTAGSLRWAFSTNYQSNWHPLTWISLMADAQIGGGSPRAFHTTNLVLHLLNTALLFLVLLRMTSSRWRSAAVAALFALHPLHVESVAWITERKDVLSTFFWLLTMLAYLAYVREPKLRRYLLVVAAFALGLMAKPMLVSLPIALLLMDYWPLGGSGKSQITNLKSQMVKLPLFALSAVSCGITFWAQSTGGSVVDTDVLPLGVRAANAVVSYATYIHRTLCPLNLTLGYAPADNPALYQVAGASLVMIGGFVLAAVCARRRPYVTVGWLWYVITLVPVIGLVQVGHEATADRYTYVPLIGLFIAIAWGVPEALQSLGAGGRRAAQGKAVPVLAVLVLAGLAACTYYQAGYWRSSVSLFSHAVEVDGESYASHVYLGLAYSDAGRYPEAAVEYLRALKMRPRLLQAHYGLGTALMRMGKLRQAAAEFECVLRAIPDDRDANSKLGLTLFLMDRLDESAECYRKVVRVSPADAGAHYNLACCLAQKGDRADAIEEFEAALRLDPGNADARRDLARLRSTRPSRSEQSR